MSAPTTDLLRDYGLSRDPKAPKAVGSDDDRAIVERVQGRLKEARVADERYRKRSLEGLKYYDDEQWDPDAKKDVEEREQEAIVINMVKSAVRVVVGLMLGHPMDWLAKPIGKNDDGVADVATAALKYVAEANLAESLYKRVYHFGLCYGVAWTRTGRRVRTKDPRREPAQMRFVDARQVRPDPESVEPDGADMRWLVWSRRVSLEDVKRNPAWKKKLADIATQAGVSDPTVSEEGDKGNRNQGLVDLTPPQSMWDRLEDWNYVDKDVSGDTTVKRVVIHEMWEIVDETAWLYEGKDGHPAEFDGPETPEGAALLQRLDAAGQLRRYYEDEVPRVYRRVVCGPYLLESERTDDELIPWVPFYYERDRHGDPRAFVATLFGLQNDLNYRASKAIWEMSGQPMRVSPEVVARMGLNNSSAAELARDPGAVWIAMPGEVEYLQRQNTATDNAAMMEQRERQIKSTSGANDDLQGTNTRGDSGIARQLTMQQGATMQRDSEANLRMFHKLLGMQMLQLLQRLHPDEWTFRITDEMGDDRFFTANAVTFDPVTGMQRKLNDMNGVRFEVTLDSMPATPTLRDRAAEVFAQMAAAEPDPIKRAVLQRIQIEAANLPGKGKALKALDEAEKMRQQTPPPPPPQKTVRDQLSIAYKDVEPQYRPAVWQEFGIQVDPQYAGTPPTPEAPAQAEQPPSLTPDAAMKAQVDLAKHERTLAHQAEQADRDRSHKVDLLHVQHGLGLEQAEHQAGLGAMAAAQKHAHGLAQTEHAAKVAPKPAPPKGGKK